MKTITPGPEGFTAALADEAATRRLAIDIANMLEPGDFVALSGGLGAGKTTFTRAMIRHLAGTPAIDVPSPTFTLVQTYDLPRFTLLHADLYRLTGPGELPELGLEDATGVIVMEWPDRAGSALPDDRFEISIALDVRDEEAEQRTVQVAGRGKAAPRAARLGALLAFLEDVGLSDAVRTRVAGDASSRSYERLTHDGKNVILMNAPRMPDGPVIKRGLPYSAIAHLAEDVKPFIAIAKGLRERGFSAPKIIAADAGAGLIVLEDLGSEPVVMGDPPVPIPERYERAVDMLIAMHRLDLPERLAVAPHVEHLIPTYDLDALLIEVELLVDWYLPHRGAIASAPTRAHFLSLWRDAVRPVLEARRTWVLRDFHSPNIMWLPGRQGIGRVGVLDFQDAVMGPGAYDVASLLQDARVDVPEDLEIALFGRYVRERRRDSGFDANGFALLYATLAAQRATKILGIFARLDRRDRKPQYLRHLPRIWGYVRRALTHPALEPLETWYVANVPPPA